MEKISITAKKCGLPPKTIRYYEEIGLIKASARNGAGYRFYDQNAIDKLTFIKRAREFGFSIPKCRTLLKLFENQERASADVKSIALMRLSEIEEKQRELQILHDELSHLAKSCQGNDNPDCPILNAMVSS